MRGTGRGRYSIGTRLWQIGFLAPQERALRDVTLPVLEGLFESTRQIVHLVVLDGHARSTSRGWLPRHPRPSRPASACDSHVREGPREGPAALRAAAGARPCPHRPVDSSRLGGRQADAGVSFKHQDAQEAARWEVERIGRAMRGEEMPQPSLDPDLEA